MAKEDFCFTYYDGDAARDKAHMNRLERGGYDDLIVSQRKFGHLSLALIKKTLGSDFSSIWAALEIILKKDDQGCYFIEWLENSVIKMRKQSEHQRENGKKGGRPKKPNESQQEPNDNLNTNPKETQQQSHKKPLENGDENVNGSEFVNEPGDSKFIVPKMCTAWYETFPGYTKDKNKDSHAMLKIYEFIITQANERGSPDQQKVLNTLSVIADQILADAFWVNKSLNSIANNIQEFYNKIKNPVNGSTSKTGRLQSIRNDASAERERRRHQRQQAGDQRDSSKL